MIAAFCQASRCQPAKRRTTTVVRLTGVNTMRRQAALLRVAALVITSLIAIPAAHAQQGEDLREAAQNPIADLISVPFQNNTNFDIGHTDNAQNVLNIQPVYPTHLNANWNLITRPILPVIDQLPFLSGPELRAAEQLVGPEI